MDIHTRNAAAFFNTNSTAARPSEAPQRGTGQPDSCTLAYQAMRRRELITNAALLANDFDDMLTADICWLLLAMPAYRNVVWC